MDINSPRALALILAGLRSLQQVAEDTCGDLGDLHDILDGTEGPDDQSLGEEIDGLCLELNEGSDPWHLFLVQDSSKRRARLISAQSGSVSKAREMVEACAEDEHDYTVAGALYLGPTDTDIDRDVLDPIED